MQWLGVLFDLDMTLVDTSCLKPLRKQRLWKEVYSHIPKTVVFPGMSELVHELSGICKMGVVTSAPRPYAERVVLFHSLPITVLSTYHDTSYHKPHPEPLLNGCQKLGIDPSMVISIGDEINDFKASQSAGIRYFHAVWGGNNLQGVPQELLCASVSDLRDRLL